MKKQILLTVVAALALSVPAPAQRVSLDSCRNMAMRNNKSIKISEENIAGAKFRKKAAFGAYLPGIDFMGTYTYNQNQIELLGEDAKLPTMIFDPLKEGGPGFVPLVVTNPLDGKPMVDPASGQEIPWVVGVIPKEAMSYDIHNVFAGAVTLTQPVFMGGQIRALNDITKSAEKLAESMKNSAIAEVIFATDEAYWQVVSLKSKQKLAEKFVGLVDSLRRNVDLMLKEGVATRSDVLMVNVKYNEAQIALTKVTNGLSLSRMALNQMCGIPVGTQMTLEDEDREVSVYAAPAPECAMDEVYNRRPELLALQHGVDVFKAKEKLALGDMLPKVALVGAYSFSNPNVIHGFQKKFGGGFSVGATLQIPVWHWGVNYYNYKAAKAETNAQRLLLEDMEEKVDLQVSQARYSYDEALKTYEMTKVNMESADANLHNAELGFREGVLTADDVLTAQTAWLQANSEKIDAEIGIHLCKVYLSKVLGNLN